MVRLMTFAEWFGKQDKLIYTYGHSYAVKDYDKYIQSQFDKVIKDCQCSWDYCAPCLKKMIKADKDKHPEWYI